METFNPTTVLRPSLRNRISGFFKKSTPRTVMNTGSPHRKWFSRKQIGTYIFIILLVLGVGAGLKFTLFSQKNAANATNPIIAGAVTDTAEINREFSFDAYDKNKKLGNKIKYVITSVQRTPQIIIKGQRATAVKGRTFLILNLKLVNEANESLFINARNYVRIQPKDTEDKLAPEIHNDTVEIQPLSTKITRVGLPVDEADKEFTIFVGEIDQDKQEIPIKF